MGSGVVGQPAWSADGSTGPDGDGRLAAGAGAERPAGADTGRLTAGQGWRRLIAADLPALADLAVRCRSVDGGLPQATQRDFLAARFLAPGGISWCRPGSADDLVAAGAVRVVENAGTSRAVFVGLVDPAHRGRGLGAALLDRGLAVATRTAPEVTVETEGLTVPAERLFAGRGLRQVFAEDVLRLDLARGAPAAAGLPAGMSVIPWAADLANRFHAVYHAAFRDRPGFPGWSVAEWTAWTSDDPDFRPEWSLLLTAPDGPDVGFVTSAEGWLVQVGVRPEYRGRGLGAALIGEVTGRMRAAGRREVLLDVNVDNPAGRLYRRLGYTAVGRRARYTPTAY